MMAAPIINTNTMMMMLSRRTTAAAVLLFTLLGKEDGIWSASAFVAVPVSSSALSLRSSASPSFHQHIRAFAVGNNNIESSTATATSSNSNVKVDFPLSNGSSSISSDNTPPNLQSILNSLASLKSGSDLRGTFVNHKCSGGTIANVSHLLKQNKKNRSGSGSGSTGGGDALLTPFAAHCFGVAFARWSLQLDSSLPSVAVADAADGGGGGEEDDSLTICVGCDPRVHGERLADSFARGAESVVGVKVVYTGIATTPSMYEFVRADKCDAAVMSESLFYCSDDLKLH